MTSIRGRSIRTAGSNAAVTGSRSGAASPRARHWAPGRCAWPRYGSAAGPWSPPAPWSPGTSPTSRWSPASPHDGSAGSAAPASASSNTPTSQAYGPAPKPAHAMPSAGIPVTARPGSSSWLNPIEAAAGSPVRPDGAGGHRTARARAHRRRGEPHPGVAPAHAGGGPLSPAPPEPPPDSSDRAAQPPPDDADRPDRTHRDQQPVSVVRGHADHIEPAPVPMPQRGDGTTAGGERDLMRRRPGQVHFQAYRQPTRPPAVGGHQPAHRDQGVAG